MNALERARHFVQTDAARTALMIVPLAMSGAAQAAPVFDANTATSVFQVTEGSSAGTADSTSTFSTLANGGVRWTGQSNRYTFDAGASGGSVACLDLLGGLTRCAISLTVSGVGSGELGADIPAHWDLFLDKTGQVSDEQYQVAFFINGAPVGSAATSAGDILLAGWAAGATLATWQVDLSASFAVRDLGEVRMVVPQHSIDITPRGAAPVPEPASLLLAATGVGWIASMRRRRRS